MDKAELLREHLALKKIFIQQKAALTQLERDKVSQEKELKKGLDELNDIGLKIELLKEASTEARNSSRDALQDMATRALQSIIGDHVSLKIELDEKGSSPVAEFLVISEYDDYLVDADPADEEGGGIADIVSFSNQISMLQLTGHRNTATVFFDEPTKYVSGGYSDDSARYLFEYSSHSERQVIMVTHDSHLAKMGDKAFMFRKVAGKSIVTALGTA